MRHWTNHEERELAQGVRDRLTNKELAAKLGRSSRAIAERCMERGLRRRRQVKVQAAPGIEFYMITISKAELPEYYEEGWRVSWFEADQVGIERPKR